MKNQGKQKGEKHADKEIRSFGKCGTTMMWDSINNIGHMNSLNERHAKIDISGDEDVNQAAFAYIA